MVRQRVRIRFSKQGDLRFVGHRDVMRCFERWFRRADLPLSFSEGFHPKPRVTFPAPLAVGMEGLDEVMELELSASWTAETLRARLQRHSPPGIRLRSVDVLPPGTPKVRPRVFHYEVLLPPGPQADLADAVERLRAATSAIVPRSGGRAPVDVRPFLDAIELHDGLLSMRILVPASGGASPGDVLSSLGRANLPREGALIVRTAVEVNGCA
ncbi:MAG: TIGR03936 family radical SAM-associated protein [Patescibacteria group bacterium]|nr:TIGR03936 family radical SAM-associated protein [Patescibacteria group bacterium]